MQIAIVFDSEVRVSTDVFWIDFLREECATAVSDKIIKAFRKTPFDADSSTAANWVRDLPFFVPSETRVVGRGLDEIYAYTFLSCVAEAEQNGATDYPMKIGYTSGVDGALQRVAGQFPNALSDDARLQFIGRCGNGRKTESKIHRRLRQDHRHLNDAPGAEWFRTNVGEVATLFAEVVI